LSKLADSECGDEISVTDEHDFTDANDQQSMAKKVANQVEKLASSEAYQQLHSRMKLNPNVEIANLMSR
jgi:hypothetical protein